MSNMTLKITLAQLVQQLVRICDRMILWAVLEETIEV